MYKKLIRVDDWHFLEVDAIRLKRTAADLLVQIEKKVPVDQDIFNFHTLTLPIIRAALEGRIIHSLDERVDRFLSGNYTHEEMEGTLPSNYDREFRVAVAKFMVAAEGLPLEEVEEVVIDGVRYAWVEIEEEGDWPDRVKYK